MLEHSRVFRSQIGDDDQVWLSSSDWMNRNMMRRVEMAWPVTDPELKQRVIEECLNLYMADNLDAWLLQPDGTYVKAQPPVAGKVRKGAVQTTVSAQATLMARYGRQVG